ncbi:hypothetical protein ACFSCX_15500 [Bacillus salitolerans]|uniref:Anti-sigma factor n=1 Tax=Bacillus salitolerans TaxID=1437434 RepID=A0ABW4LS97_9BACI
MSCLYEEKVVDLALEKVEVAEELRIRKHMETCHPCKELYEYWDNMFDAQSVTIPSIKIKLTIVCSILVERLKQRAVLLPALIMASLLLMANVLQAEDPKNRTVPFNSENSPFLVKTDTRIYDLVPDVSNPVSGYAWINTSSEELMLVMEGLKPSMLNEYQAWIQTKNELKDAGIIMISGQTGQLYIKDRTVPMLEYIIISQEPHGGSFRPTDPNAFLLKLNQK